MSALTGQVVVNTRPLHQQAELEALLVGAGAHVLAFPVIEIVTPEKNPHQTELIDQIEQFDILVFISRNAVSGGLNLIGSKQLSDRLQFAVIGAATQAELVASVPNLDRRLISSEPFNSESLLRNAAFKQVSGKRILIFRGQAGRSLLGDELTARGAEVNYCEVYRRALPSVDAEAFDRLAQPVFPTMVVLTSNHGMHNLIRLVTPSTAQRLITTPWLLISERMRESALELGHNAPLIVAAKASDQGIFETIFDWANPA